MTLFGKSVVLALGIACTAFAQDGAGTRATVSGHVVDALGEPLRACRVELEHLPAAAEQPAQTLTDGDGLFVFQVPAEERTFRVRAASPGRVTAFGYAGVRAPRWSDRVSLRLWDAGVIRGRVVAPDGSAVEGAEVIADYGTARVFGFDPQGSGASDAEGRFELEGVPLGWIQVRAWKQGFSMIEESLWLRDEGEAVLHLSEAPGVRMEVRVDGLPAGAEAHLLVLGDQVLSESLMRGVVGPDAPWIRSGLPDHRFRISLSAEGYTFAPDELVRGPGGHPLLARFRATPAPDDVDQASGGALVRGLLRNLEGEPLSGERLVIRHHQGGRRTEVVTDDEGRFEGVAPRAAGTPCILYPVDSEYVTAQTKVDGHIGVRDARFWAYHEFVVGEADEL